MTANKTKTFFGI